MLIPADKSITHRALMLAAIAEGESLIEPIPSSDDVQATVSCLEQLGVLIYHSKVTPPQKWPEAKQTLHCGESGTTFRLMLGLLSGLPVRVDLIGSGNLIHRPMNRVVEPLRKMGADIDLRIEGENLIATIVGKKLKGIRHINLIPSAQVKSAILLASLFAEGETVIEEPVTTRDHTELLLKEFGASIEVCSNPHVIHFCPSRLHAKKIHIPGDISSAAFLIAEGLL